jgi:DNA-binding NarL/FixJ family response regulator
MEHIRVFVADDQALFRELVEAELGMAFCVVPGASTLADADAAFARGDFDVAFIDLSWANEGPVTPRLPLWRRLHPTCRWIMLTGYNEHGLCKGYLASGAQGFLVKQSTMAELSAAVQKVMQGEIVVGSQVIAASQVPCGPHRECLPPTTTRVLQRLAEGWSRKQIAKEYRLHINTVDYHIVKLKEYFRLGPKEKPSWARLMAGGAWGEEG